MSTAAAQAAPAGPGAFADFCAAGLWPGLGRALVGHLLARASRDGHTAVPADVIVRSVARFRIDDPVAAVAAAVDDGSVIPFDDAPATPEAEPAVLLALARYALAEETVA